MDFPIFVTDDDREETITERRDRERAVTASGKAENEEHIPLIPNVKADQRKTIVHLEVWKVNPPGDGFKGKVAPTATPETIAKLFGDGTYDIHAIAGDGKTLRRNSGVKVAWVNPDDPAKGVAMTQVHAPDKELNLLTWQSEQHDKSSARTEAFGKMVVDTVREHSKQQQEAQARAHEIQVTRDREFFQSQMVATREWFSTLMLQQAQSHQHTMERSEQNFRQAMEVMRSSHERQMQTQNPNAHLRIFQEAMQFMGSMGMLGEGEDEGATPWVAAIEAAGEAIGDITDAYKTKMQTSVQAPPKQLPEPAPKMDLQPAKIAKPVPRNGKKRGPLRGKTWPRLSP